MLAAYREHPQDFYLLRVGYGGAMGALTNIDQEGFVSAAFHAYPDMLKFDPLSGDYGPNFFGHALNAATYVVKHPEFGWLAFGGKLDVKGSMVRVTPLDSFRMRVYIAPLGAWLTLDARKFESVEYNSATRVLRIGLAAATKYTPAARLRVEQPGALKTVGSYRPLESFPVERGAYVVPPSGKTTWIELRTTD